MPTSKEGHYEHDDPCPPQADGGLYASQDRKRHRCGNSCQSSGNASQPLHLVARDPVYDILPLTLMPLERRRTAAGPGTGVRLFLQILSSIRSVGRSVTGISIYAHRLAMARQQQTSYVSDETLNITDVDSGEDGAVDEIATRQYY